MLLSTMDQKASRFLECCVCAQNAGLQKQNAHKLTVKAVRLATADNERDRVRVTGTSISTVVANLVSTASFSGLSISERSG